MQLEDIKKGRRLVCGDIHGNYKGLVQCLDRAKFDNSTDTLIQLGDVADGWSQTRECVDVLLSIPKLIAIRGNHDDWTLDFLRKGRMDDHHFSQGGKATFDSYHGYYGSLEVGSPQAHIDFFANQEDYFKDTDGTLFVHGGFNRHYTLKENEESPYIFYWDRDLWLSALSFKEIDILVNGKMPKFKIAEPDVKEVFLGHITTMNWKTDQPMHAANIWNLDTGSGWVGKLTIMDVDTKEYWQSDLVQDLYPLETGRR